MIVSFKDKRTKLLSEGKHDKHVPHDLTGIIRMKIGMLNRAKQIDDLLVPRGNHFEKLRGNRKDEYSIRVNDQYRICFKIDQTSSDFLIENVEFTDYH